MPFTTQPGDDGAADDGAGETSADDDDDGASASATAPGEDGGDSNPTIAESGEPTGEFCCKEQLDEQCVDEAAQLCGAC